MDISVNERPFVTMAFIAYNSELFIREAVESALAQTYSPLEIILSDDCSTDQTFPIMRELAARYRGPHRLVVNRNSTNLRAQHVNRVLDMARGEFIVQIEGDDISVPERTATLVERWLAGGRSRDLICSYFAEINEQGLPTGYIKKEVMFVPELTADVSTWRCGATGATASYTPKVYRKYGPIDRDVLSVDWVMPFRAWLEGGIDLVEKPLVKHRTHGGSVSQQVKNLERLKARAARYAMRRKVQAGEAAIAQEWLKAWRIAKKGQETSIERNLERLVRTQNLKRDAFDSSFFRQGQLLAKVLRLGGPREAAKFFYRHILRVY